MTDTEWKQPSADAVNFLHQVCSAGERCECAIGSSLWYSPSCAAARAHALVHARLMSPVKQQGKAASAFWKATARRFAQSRRVAITAGERK